jgi:hypothetical protein
MTSRLVSRVIPVLGVIGAPLILASATATLFGLYDQVSGWAAVTAIPVGVCELALGVWLVVKGFRPSPITTGIGGTGTAPADHDVAA